MKKLAVRRVFGIILAIILTTSLVVLAVPTVGVQAKSYKPMVSAGGYHTVGLKSDGTVVATGNNGVGQCDISAWMDITQVSAGYMNTVGLKSDGTVVYTGHTGIGEDNVTSWAGIDDIRTYSSVSAWRHTHRYR